MKNSLSWKQEIMDSLLRRPNTMISPGKMQNFTDYFIPCDVAYICICSQNQKTIGPVDSSSAFKGK